MFEHSIILAHKTYRLNKRRREGRKGEGGREEKRNGEEV